MKSNKFLSVIALSALVLSANAVNKVKITLTGANGANAAELNILEKSGSSIDWTETTDGEPINMWAVYNSVKYSSLYALDIQGIKIGFKGNSNTSYKMTFTKFDGAIKLYDAELDSVIEVANNGTYEFTATADSLYADRFQVGEPVKAYTRDGLTVGDWGTICVKYNSNQLEGGLFYKPLGTKDADKGVALEQVTALNAGYPYVFQATATEIKVTYTSKEEATDTIQSGNMVGSFYGCPVPAGMYLIVNNALYKAEGTTNSIGANRAYFDVANMGVYTPAPGRRVVFFGGKSTATDMEEVAAPAMNGKMIINGQLIIMKDGKMFNAQGAAL